MTDCVFCRIAASQIPAKIAARNDRAVAFHDLNPQAPVHVLVIPTEHVSGPNDAGSGTSVWTDIMSLATAVAEQLGIAASGFRLVVNQGQNGGQSVDHLHVHLLGGRRMTWPPG